MMARREHSITYKGAGIMPEETNDTRKVLTFRQYVRCEHNWRYADASRGTTRADIARLYPARSFRDAYRRYLEAHIDRGHLPTLGIWRDLSEGERHALCRSRGALGNDLTRRRLATMTARILSEGGAS